MSEAEVAVDLDGDGEGADAATGLGRASLVNLVGFGIYGIANFALIVVITRQLGTDGAGALLLAIAVFSILARTTMAGSDLALVRFTSRFLARHRHAELRRLYRVALVPVATVSGLAGLAMFVLAVPLADILAKGAEHDAFVAYLRVLAPFVPIASVYQVLEGGSRGFGTMLPSVAVERIGRSIVLPGLMLVVLSAGASATVIGLAWAGPFALAVIPMGLWCLVLIRRAEAAARGAAPGAIAPRELGRRVWSFALPRAFAGMFAFLISWIDSLLLGAMEGTEAVGIYSAATRWLIVGNFAGTAVTQAFGPRIARVLTTHGPDEGRTLFQQSAALLVVVAWPAYLAAMVFAPVLLQAFGDDFVSGARVVVIVGFGFLIASSTGPIDMLLLMAGRSRLSMINAGVSLGVNVAANVVLIPRLGIEGAAWAWALSLVVANALPTVQMWRALGIQPYGARTLNALLVTGAAGLAMVAGRAALGPTVGGMALGLSLAGVVIAVGVAVAPDRLGLPQLLRRSAAW